jgi:hypothetical protein
MYPIHVKALRVGRACFGLFLGLGLLGGAAPARAGDVTAFVAFPRPSSNWDRGYGAALTSTWFNAISFEGEAARIPGKTTDENMTSFTASALISPPVGSLTPYGGIGYGLFRQTAGSDSDTGRLQPYGGLGVGIFREAIASDSDTGTHRAFIVGAKLTLGLLVVKSDYRWIHVPDDALLPFDRRFQIAGGIHF